MIELELDVNSLISHGIMLCCVGYMCSDVVDETKGFFINSQYLKKKRKGLVG